MDLCNKEQCTGCGACAFVCGKKCIQMLPDQYGTIYPVINPDTCISCGACQSVCPALRPVSRRENLQAYAAWSNHPEERRTSASGGIAAEMYHYALAQGYSVCGAELNEQLETVFTVTTDGGKIASYKNSKYVFSSMYTLYPVLKKLLKEKKKVMVICLPCQAAALRNLFQNDGNLFLADVVCHGTTNQAFLNQHIEKLEEATGEKAAYVSFRDPQRDTVKYYFSLYNADGKCFYTKRTSEGDLYQIGYHRSISYRENCYHCQYAGAARVSDITLSDYKGLGTMADCTFSQDKVSLVLVHTDKGAELINALISEKRIYAEVRPTQEGIQGDPQLNHPSVKSYGRIVFEKKIVKYNGQFERAMNDVVRAVKVRRYEEKFYRGVVRVKHLFLGKD